MKPQIIREADGLRLLGGRQTIKLTTDDTDGKLSFILSEVPAGTGVPRHTHQNEDEIFQIMEGSLEVTVDKDLYTLNEGDLIFLPRNIAHGFRALTNTRMWVSFTPAGAEKMFIDLAALPPGLPDPQSLTAICGRYAITFE